MGSPSDSIPSPGFTYTATTKLPIIPGVEYWTYQSVSLGSGSGSAMISQSKRSSTPPTSVAFSADALALVTAAPIDNSVLARPKLQWVVDQGPRGDVGLVSLVWNSGNATLEYLAYFAPDSSTTFNLPDMPDEVTSYRPSEASTLIGGSVAYYDLEGKQGFADSVSDVEVWHWEEGVRILAGSEPAP
jgi:hypothetical protein